MLKLVTLVPKGTRRMVYFQPDAGSATCGPSRNHSAGVYNAHSQMVTCKGCVKLQGS